MVGKSEKVSTLSACMHRVGMREIWESIFQYVTLYLLSPCIGDIIRQPAMTVELYLVVCIVTDNYFSEYYFICRYSSWCLYFAAILLIYLLSIIFIKLWIIFYPIMDIFFQTIDNFYQILIIIINQIKHQYL